MPDISDKGVLEKIHAQLTSGVSIVVDGKATLHGLWQLGIPTQGLEFYDVSLAGKALTLGFDQTPLGFMHQKSGQGQFPLDCLVEKYLPHMIGIDPRLREVKTIRDLWNQPTEQELAFRDAMILREVYLEQVKDVRRAGLMEYLREVEFRYMVANARIEWTGIKICKQRLDGVRGFIEAKADQYASDLQRNGLCRPGSIQEFQDYLLAHGLQGSLSKEDLEEKKLKEIKGLLKRNPHLTQVITAFFQHRDFKNLRSTWCKDLQFHEGRMHPVHQQLGAKTGRTTMKGIPVSNLPKPLRSLVIADEGNLIVEYDICAADAVIMAAVFGEESLLEAYREGDIYVAIAKKYFADSLIPEDQLLSAIGFKEKHGDKRDFCKTLFLSISYGKTAYGIAQEEGTPLTEAQARIDHLLNEFPLVREGLSRLEQNGLETGYAHIYKGLKRCVHIGNTRSERASAGRICKNTPIQGLTAVVMKIATVAIDRKLQATGAKIIFTNHDAFIIETPPESLDCVRQVVSQAVLEAGQQISPLLHLKVDSKSESSTYWFHGRGTLDFDDYVGSTG